PSHAHFTEMYRSWQSMEETHTFQTFTNTTLRGLLARVDEFCGAMSRFSQRNSTGMRPKQEVVASAQVQMNSIRRQFTSSCYKCGNKMTVPFGSPFRCDCAATPDCNICH